MGGEIRDAMRDERAYFARPQAGALQTADTAEGRLPARRPSFRSSSLPAMVEAGRRWRPLVVARQAVGREWARGTGFLCLPVLFGAGALCYFVLPFEPRAHVLVLGSAVLLACAVLSGARFVPRMAFAAALVFVLGLGAAKIETWRAGTAMVGSDVTTRITGRVVRIEAQASGRSRLTIDLTGTARPELHYPPARVRLTARAVPAGLKPGDGVTGLARLMSPSGPVRPHSYDFSFESYFDGIGAVGFFMKEPEPAALPEPPSWTARLGAWLAGLRQGLAGRVRGQIGGAAGEVAAALIAGERGGIPEATNEVLRKAGLAHVLAISGLHMALVAFTVMGTIRAGFAFFPGFASRRPVKKYAAAAALSAGLLYLFISGAAVAAQRSFLMLAVMLTALIFDRAAITMRNLAIAALIIIVLSPHEVMGPSFQMSFAATAALIAGYAAWNAWRERRLAARDLPHSSVIRSALHTLAVYGGGLLLTSLIAGAATAIFGIWHFQRASPLALLANLAAMPVVSLVVMPMAVAGAVLMPFGLDGWVLTVMGKGIAAVIAIALWVSERSPFDATGAIPVPAVALFAAALVVLALSTTRLRLAAVPLLVAGTALIAARELPDVLISEDGRLVGMRMADGALAVNRGRPNGFTVENWLRTINADRFAKPFAATGGEAAQVLPGSGESVFFCGEGLCLARHAGGALIVHAGNRDQVRAYCRTARLIVLDDAAEQAACQSGAAVVTKRDLARRGAAAIWLPGQAGGETLRIVFAVNEPWRPWHEHRAWSRAARGLPPNEGWD